MGYKIKTNYDELKRLASNGLTHAQIAASLIPPMSSRTYYRRLSDDPEFAQAVETGFASLAIEVSAMLLKRARSGCIESIKFLAERRCNYHKNADVAVNISAGDTPMLNIFLQSPDGSVKNLSNMRYPLLEAEEETVE